LGNLRRRRGEGGPKWEDSHEDEFRWNGKMPTFSDQISRKRGVEDDDI